MQRKIRVAAAAAVKQKHGSESWRVQNTRFWGPLPISKEQGTVCVSKYSVRLEWFQRTKRLDTGNMQ